MEFLTCLKTLLGISMETFCTWFCCLKWGSVPDWAGTITAVIGVIYAYNAYRTSQQSLRHTQESLQLTEQSMAQTRQLTMDSVRPYLNIKFSVKSECLFVELTNNGLGPLIFTNDPYFTINDLPFNNNLGDFQNLLYNQLQIGDVNTIRLSLHEGDSLRVGESKKIISHTFLQPLVFDILAQLQQRLANENFTLTVNYRSMYDQNFQTIKTYQNNI
jgi:hypothetical protein